MSESLFRPLFVPEAFRAATGGSAWLQAMLDAEAALAVAEARVGLIPAEAAEAIAACCFADRFDPEEIGQAGWASGNPVPPLVRALTEAVPDPAAAYVHQGATSQDILDTAAMLVSRRALDLILSEVDGISEACARLADDHRATIMAGRTLLQQALPTTFGLKAAGWLVAVLEARKRLRATRETGLAAQLGGAAGTLASLDRSGIRVLEEFAGALDLPVPVVPWHTSRFRIAEIGNTLALLAGVLHKMALDIVLMAQAEVAEVAEPSDGGRGGSSTLPHKRNPIGSVLSSAGARRVQSLAGTLQAAIAQEHERAAGGWHAEWEALGDALALTGGLASEMRRVVKGLQVYPDRMRKNLAATGGLLLAENVTKILAEYVGRLDAHDLVSAAAQRTLDAGGLLREELLEIPEVNQHLSPEEVDAALDPGRYLGSAEEFVDRALALYRKEMTE
ncbi:MAG: 3-carboxy-cis,cis-muconate cycloisomerase [Rubrobacteraceae bacterium]